MGRTRIDINKSTVHGNVVAGDYITNLGEDEIQKIIEQTLSAQQVQIIAEEEKMLAGYAGWLILNTGTFTIPGLKAPLPITEAWVRLKVLGDNKALTEKTTLKAQLAVYHEWERLSRRDDVFNAEDVTELGYRVIVIGGPGSGKSTLLRRAAHQLAAAGQKVVLVRLPLVVKRLRQGIRIEDALLETSLDGSGIDKNNLKLLLPPDCILADGLDECDPYRDQIAEALTRIASVWKTSRIIITTRPIGYDPAQFFDWTHTELLPLNSEAVKKYGEQIINTILSDFESPNIKAKEFNEELRTNKVASLAARSPLLLGFLLSLFLDGESLGQTRACIYSQILELWLRRSAREREIILDQSTARRSLEIIGWLLLNGSERRADYKDTDLIKDLGEMLGRELGSPKLASQNLAEQCILYWQELGILEYLTFGTLGTYTFVHLTLQEYTAARYLAALEQSEISEWLKENCKNPHWRETILLASGISKVDMIVNELLHVESPSDPVATSHELAAAALQEFVASPDLCFAVLDVLTERLKSPVSDVAYESAQQAAEIASQNGAYTASLIQPLLSHEQEWTRLAALRILLACGDDYMDIKVLKNCLLSGRPESQKTESGINLPRTWQIWNDVVYNGVPLLARKQPNDETVDIIKQLLNNGEVSLHTMKILPNVLKQLGHEEIALEYFSRFSSPFKGLSNFSMEPFRRADIALIESAGRCAAENNNTSIQAGYPQFFDLGSLYTALNVYETSLPDWAAIAKSGETEVLDAVIEGMINTLQISRTVLKKEVETLLAKIEDDEGKEDNSRVDLFSILPRIPVDIDWKRGNVDGLLSENLVRALSHPSQIIAFAAAKLLAARPDEKIARLTEELLQHGNDQELKLLAKISRFIWGNNAGEILLSRLQGDYSEGCRWLYEEVPELVLEEDRKRLLEVMVKGLQGQDEQTVIGVAKGLNKMEAADLSFITKEIKESLCHWFKRGLYCEGCSKVFHGSSCPKCHVVPASPQADLIRALNKIEGMTFEELANLLHLDEQHHDVVKAAKEGINSLFTKDQTLLAESLKSVGEGKYSQRVLEAILSLDAHYLAKVENEILDLLDIGSSKIKGTIIACLGSAAWISKEKAEIVLRKEIGDKDPVIRNRAVKALRRISLKE